MPPHKHLLSTTTSSPRTHSRTNRVSKTRETITTPPAEVEAEATAAVEVETIEHQTINQPTQDHQATNVPAAITIGLMNAGISIQTNDQQNGSPRIRLFKPSTPISMREQIDENTLHSV
jgi:hypothetical protein